MAEDIAVTPNIKKNKRPILIVGAVVLVAVVAVAAILLLKGGKIEAGQSSPLNSVSSTGGFVIPLGENRLALSVMPYGYRHDPEDADEIIEQGIIAMDNDGKNIVVLSQNYGAYMSYCGEWLYFSNVMDDYKLYKVRLDGTEEQKVLDKVANKTIADGDKLYFYNATDKSICSLDTETNDVVTLESSLGATEINISGDRIYYLKGDAQRSIWTMKKDGSDKRESLVIDAGYQLTVHNGYQYFVQGDFLKKAKIGSDEIEDVSIEGIFKYAILDDENIAFISSVNSGVYTMPFTGVDPVSASMWNCRNVGVANGRVFAVSVDTVLKKTPVGSYVEYSRYSDTNPDSEVGSDFKPAA